ncbi:MAG TPA: flagellar basal-body MS-ring/collar protein FliF, partial [Chroococcales cyanobacterium]
MNFLQNLSGRQKVLIGGGLALVVVLIIVLVAVLGGNKKPQADQEAGSGYVTLFQQMQPKEAGEAAGKLKEGRIDVKLTQEGTAIAVPKEKVDEARITLAMAGLPRDGVKGYEIFDKKDFMSTDFDKKMSYVRAINGELTRLVKKIDGVEDAVVYVTMPEDQLFQQEKKPTTAAVMIKMASFRVLQPGQIEGLAHMVASSVPGLNTDNVTITDANGTLLSGGFEANAGNQSDRLAARQISLQMQLKQQMENTLESRLTTLLDKLLGMGKSVVRVSIDLDFNKRTERNSLLAPVVANGEPVAVNRVQSEESNRGKGGSGVPGTTSNIPSYPSLPGEGGGNESSKKNSQESLAFNRQEQMVTSASGNITRLSSAVLVQGIRP